MEATEFVALVRRMRAAQKAYYQHDGKKDPAGKQSKLISSKQLEADVDRAEVVFTITSKSPHGFPVPNHIPDVGVIVVEATDDIVEMIKPRMTSVPIIPMDPGPLTAKVSSPSTSPEEYYYSKHPRGKRTR